MATSVCRHVAVRLGPPCPRRAPAIGLAPPRRRRRRQGGEGGGVADVSTRHPNVGEEGDGQQSSDGGPRERQRKALLAATALGAAAVGISGNVAPAMATMRLMLPRTAERRTTPDLAQDSQGQIGKSASSTASTDVRILPPLSTFDRVAYRAQELLLLDLEWKLLGFVGCSAAATGLIGTVYVIAQGQARSVREAMISTYLLLLNAPGGSLLPSDHPNKRSAVVANLTFGMGLLVFAVFLGLVCDDIAAKVHAVKCSNFRIPASGHTVVLNWNEATANVLRQMDLAEVDNPGFLPQLAVVLSSRNKEAMDAEVADLGLKRIRVATREGNTYSPTALQIVGAERARSVLLMHPAESNDRLTDHATMLQDESRKAATLLSLDQVCRAASSTKPEVARPRIIVQSPYEYALSEQRGDDVCAMTGIKYSNVFGMETMGQVIAHAAVEEGVAAVYEDLFTSEGTTDELYVCPVPDALVGRTFMQASRASPESVLLGVLSASGTPELMPSGDRVLRADESLIHISDKIELTPKSRIPQSPWRLAPQASTATSTVTTRESEPLHVLICGWEPRISNAVDEMARLLPRGSRVTLLFEEEPAEFAASKKRVQRGVQLSYRRGKPYDYADLSQALASGDGRAGTPDALVLMSRMDVEDDDESASSKTLATVVKMGKIISGQGRPLPRVVGVCANSEVERVLLKLYKDLGGERDEILNPRDMVAGAAAQMLLSQGVGSAYHSLLVDPEAPRMQSWLAHHYVAPGEACTFWEIQAAAERLGQVAVGFACEGKDIELNPDKSAVRVLDPDDKIIVLAR